MKPYASYKPSGVAWLGDVPAHWEVNTIKRGYEITLGKMLQTEQKASTDVSAPYLRSANVQAEKVDVSDVQTMWFTEHEVQQLALEPNDLVVCEGGDAGRSAIWHGEIDGCYFQNSVNRVRGVGHNTTFYLMRWLGVVKSCGYMDIVCNKATIAHLTKEKLANLPMLFPPPDEQQAIADYLDTETARIDTLVQEKEELIGLLREARSNRISELISGDGLPGSATGNPWAPHLPEGWQLKRLKHLAQVRSGLAKGKDTGSNTTVELPYLRVANVQEGRLDLREISTMPVEVDAVERFSLLEGDVLMNEGGDYDKVGRGAVWTGEISPCLHQNHVFAVRPVQRDLSEWISAITQTQYAKFYFMNNAKQSTNLASISQASVKELPILLPPKEQRDALLEKLGGELAAFDALITHTQEEIALLKELRAATIADAVLGRVDVRSLTQKQ